MICSSLACNCDNCRSSTAPPKFTPMYGGSPFLAGLPTLVSASAFAALTKRVLGLEATLKNLYEAKTAQEREDELESELAAAHDRVAALEAENARLAKNEVRRAVCCADNEDEVKRLRAENAKLTKIAREAYQADWDIRTELVWAGKYNLQTRIPEPGALAWSVAGLLNAFRKAKEP